MSVIPTLRATHEQSVFLNRTENERAAPCYKLVLRWPFAHYSSLITHHLVLPEDALDRLQNDMAVFRQRIALALQRPQAIVHLTQKLFQLGCGDADFRPVP